MFAQSAASEARLVRMAHHSLDQVKGLLSRVQQEVGSVKLSRMRCALARCSSNVFICWEPRARQDPRIVDKFNPGKSVTKTLKTYCDLLIVEQSNKTGSNHRLEKAR